MKEDDDHETAESLNAKENIDNRDMKRKKKKKKKKTSNRYHYNARSSEDNFEVLHRFYQCCLSFPPHKSTQLLNFQDEVERSVREVNELLGNEEVKNELPVCSTETDISSLKEMDTLKIESRHLNPNNEFKRIFGPKVVNTSVEFRYLMFVSLCGLETTSFLGNFQFKRSLIF